MTRQGYRQLIDLALSTRLAEHVDSVFVAAKVADAAQRMALALGAINERESARYFDLISNAMKFRREELRTAPIAPRPWFQVHQ